MRQTLNEKERIYLIQLQSTVQKIIKNTPQDEDKITLAHRHFLSIHIKDFFQLLEKDMRSEMKELEKVIRPVMPFSCVRDVRNGLRHSYFSITDTNLYQFCRYYIPAFNVMLTSLSGNQAIDHLTTRLDQYELINQARIDCRWVTDKKTNRTLAQYASDLLHHAQAAEELAGIPLHSPQGTLRDWAVQDCIEIYGEICQKIVIIKEIIYEALSSLMVQKNQIQEGYLPEGHLCKIRKAKNELVQFENLMNSTNKYQDIRIKDVAHLRNMSAHQIRALENKDVASFIKSISQLLASSDLETSVSTAEGRYDLLFMPVDTLDKGLIDGTIKPFLRRNLHLRDLPIIIAFNDNFFIYGKNIKDKEENDTWGLIDLDIKGMTNLSFCQRGLQLTTNFQNVDPSLSLQALKKRYDFLQKSDNYDELEIRKKQINALEKITKEHSRDKKDVPGKAHLVPISTKGDGDCALHAILGVWVKEENQFICQDLKTPKEAIKTAINDNKGEKELEKLITASIIELVMSGSDIGEHTQDLRISYHHFLAEKNYNNPKDWHEFELILRSEAKIVNYINQNHKLTGLPSFREKFYDALNANKADLYRQISLIPKLQQAFNQYNKKLNTEFNWEHNIAQNSKNLKKEYANFITAPRTWLLPSELAIIAHVSKIPVIYHPYPGSPSMVFNPKGEKPAVEIQFNGINHYERLEFCQNQIFMLPASRVPKKVYQTIGSKAGHFQIIQPTSTIIMDSKKEAAPKKLQTADKVQENRDKVSGVALIRQQREQMRNQQRANKKRKTMSDVGTFTPNPN